jgi:hypothetical protein
LHHEFQVAVWKLELRFSIFVADDEGVANLFESLRNGLFKRQEIADALGVAPRAVTDARRRMLRRLREFASCGGLREVSQFHDFSAFFATIEPQTLALAPEAEPGLSAEPELLAEPKPEPAGSAAAVCCASPTTEPGTAPASSIPLTSSLIPRPVWALARIDSPITPS